MHSVDQKQTPKFRALQISKLLSELYYRELKTQRMEGHYVDPDEMTHYEPPHLDLACMQIQLFSVLFLQGLRNNHKLFSILVLHFDSPFMYACTCNVTLLTLSILSPVSCLTGKNAQNYERALAMRQLASLKKSDLRAYLIHFKQDFDALAREK